ncbi:hypothetical protein G6F62_002720 [Rhizopus arrhizus]|nr:hypothetical protein G6F62_002720 [Rhizopus arrhizus]
MRLTHSLLLTTIVTTTIVYTVSSVPISPSDLALPRNALASLPSSNTLVPNQFEKRGKHNHKKHSKSKKNKRYARKKKTTKRKTVKKTTKKSTKKKTTKKSSGSSGKKYSGDGTFYSPGLGSCGITNSDSDMVAALNAPQMNNPANPNNNPLCGKYINVHGHKGTVRVKIVDTCPPCKSGDVDLSTAAFGKIANYDEGRVPITWSWA